MIGKCLFCKGSTETSVSKEHVIPDSIGSKKTLPKGIVCDSCNNYFSIKIEGPLLSHRSMRNLRAYYQIPNKKNKIASMLGVAGEMQTPVTLRLDKKGCLEIGFENEVSQLFANTEHAFPLVFSVDINPPKNLMSRLLAKMALEAMAYRYVNNPDWLNVLFDDHYSPIRNYARFGIGSSVWPYHQRQVMPATTQMRDPETAQWKQIGVGHDLFLTSVPETFFVFAMYGEEFVINVGGPSVKGYEEWLKENDNISPLVERVGSKLVSKIIDGNVIYFLEGDSDIVKGTQFDKERLRQFAVDNLD